MRLFTQLKRKVFPVVVLSIIMAGCGNNLKEEKAKYEEDMKPIYAENEKYVEVADQLDLKKIENIYVGAENKLNQEELDKYKEILNDNLVPISSDMNEDIKNVEVTHEDLKEIHDQYKENVDLKTEFAEELGAYIDIYTRSIEINKQLTDYGEKVLENKKARDALIVGDKTPEEQKEIKALVKVINENSEDLEKEATMLQKDMSIAEKEKHINEVLMPLLDAQIANINKLSIKTNKGKQVRTLSLEMFYTFKSYYEERANLMRVYEEEGKYQLQTILPKYEASKKITAKYEKALKKLDKEK